MLYWAYGSNLCIEQMKRRCPAAIKLEKLVVDDGELIFRGVADVRVKKGSSVQGGLWRITKECEAELDFFEGVNSETRTYLKRYMLVERRGRKEDVLFYQMRTHRGIMPPTERYYATIRRGYKDFGLDVSALHAAVDAAWDNKDVTPQLRYKHEQRGTPRLVGRRTIVQSHQNKVWKQ